jgi:site-specific DNA-methyltransferase (cytosine-N4-specific)
MHKYTIKRLLLQARQQECPEKRGYGWLPRRSPQRGLEVNMENPTHLVNGKQEYYATKWGAAYHGDALELLERVDDDKIDLIVTSPPFALVRQKRYGHRFDHIGTERYVEWFRPFAKQFHRILSPLGSLVVHIGGSWDAGQPTKSLYHFELLLSLCKELQFSLAQDFYWFNPAKFPSPAEWVTVKRIRVKDSVDPVWWLCKDPEGKTKANNTNVLWNYSESMLRLFKRAKYNAGVRPSGYYVSPTSFLSQHSGAIPPNLLPISNTESNGSYLRNCRNFGVEVNPARFPVALPEFFINFLTNKGDIVLDPFAGSNTTGFAAEKVGRRWLAFEIYEEYLKGSKFRFFTSIELGLENHEQQQMQPSDMQQTPVSKTK